MLTSEFEINDAPLSARNGLTKGHIQDEIRQFSGCAVTTRGRYMTAAERLKNPSERALYLFIQGPSKQNLDLAIQKIDEIIRMEQNSNGFKNRGNPSYMMTPNVTSVEKVYVGIENVLPSFDLRGKLIGVRGANLNYIRSETGAIVTLRGKGSLFIDPHLGAESSEPLHLYIEHPKHEGLNAAKQLALNLIETLQQEVAQLHPQVVIQPQIPQQVNIYPGQNALHSLNVQHNDNVINFKPNAPPPQLNIPPPGIHIPTQQGPMLSQPPPNNSQIPVIQTIDGQTNFSGTTNQVILTNNSGAGLMSAVPSSSGQQIYCTPSNQNLIQNIQTTNQQVFQQHISMPIQMANRNQNIDGNTINMGQYQAQAPPNQQIHQDVATATQYSTSQNSTSQIVGFNNLAHFVPAAQIPQTGQIPQMQIVQSANQPLHILSSQGLTLQNHPQFIQQPIQMNQLQSSNGTINTLQVPGNSSGSMTFQIPIQTQNTSFIPQSNIQNQGSVLLTQQNLQSSQNLQQSVNVSTAQFQLQQPQFSNQVPIIQNIQASQTPYLSQGQQMGVYTTQGLVLVQNQQSLTTMQAMSNFNPSLVANNSSSEISQNSNNETSTNNLQIQASSSQDQKVESIEGNIPANHENVGNKLSINSNENTTLNSQQILHLEQNQEQMLTQNVHQFNQMQMQTNQVPNYQNTLPQNYHQTSNVSINNVSMSLQQIQNINENNSNLISNQTMTFPIQPSQTISVTLPHQQLNQEIHSTQIVQGTSNQDSHGCQSKKRKYSETGQIDDENQEDPSGMKKSGVGVDQAQFGKSIPANNLPRGNFTQLSQSSCGLSSDDSQMVDGCRSFETQNQIMRSVRDEQSTASPSQDFRGVGGNVSSFYNNSSNLQSENLNCEDTRGNSNGNINDNWQQWNSNNGMPEPGNVDSNFQVRSAMSPARMGGQMRSNLPYKYHSQYSSRANIVRTPYSEQYRRERPSYQYQHQQHSHQNTQRPQQGWFPQSGNGNNMGSWM